MAELRPFRAGDLDGIVAVLAAACPREHVDAERFANHVLLDEGFEADGLLVAVAEGEVVGVCHGVVADRQRYPLPAGAGWISLLAVDPAHQRQGIGGALLDGVLAWLRGRGASRVDFCAYPPGYFVPGLDQDAYPDAVALLESRGFVRRVQSVGQSVPVVEELPGSVTKLIDARLAEGYELRPATWGDLPEVIEWASRAVAPDWGDILRHEVIARHRPDRILLCRSPQGDVVGFSTYASYDGDVARFGPIGVDPGQRGKALGAILLAQTMARQAGEGARESYFLWGETEGVAFDMYARAGWTVNRRFHLLRKEF